MNPERENLMMTLRAAHSSVVSAWNYADPCQRLVLRVIEASLRALLDHVEVSK